MIQFTIFIEANCLNIHRNVPGKGCEPFEFITSGTCFSHWSIKRKLGDILSKTDPAPASASLRVAQITPLF